MENKNSLIIRIERLEKECEVLNKKTNNITVKEACVDEKLNSIMVTLSELKSGLYELRYVPQKRWEKVVGTIITSIVTLIFGILFGKYV